MSEVEPPEDLAFSEHERELLVHYTHNTGHDFREEVSYKLPLGREGGKMMDGYRVGKGGSSGADEC